MDNKTSPDLIDSIIFQAGTDNEARTMLQFNACHLPDPKGYDYDLLLDQITTKLDSIVENDYILILFSAQVKHAPSWKWLYRAYQTLQRKFKKHLKCLIVVHPGLWTRLLMDTTKMLVSPKFARKLVHVVNLSQLAKLVPYRQLHIPEAVLEYNQKMEVVVSIPEPPLTARTTFGIPLETLMGDQEGIFRRSPSSTQLKEAKARINEGLDPNLSSYDMPVHIACVLIKIFLRELPQPIFPVSIYPQLQRLQLANDDASRFALIRQLISEQLTPSQKRLFAYLIPFWSDVAKNEATNKMSASNLAIVIGPNLVRSPNPMDDLAIGPSVSTLLTLWIDKYAEEWQALFDEKAFSSVRKSKESEKEPVLVLPQTEKHQDFRRTV